jgi:plastocyanin
VKGRKRYLPLILALGVGVGLLPSLAQGVAPPSTSSFTAVAGPKWAAPDGSKTVYIAPDGVVTFSNPTTTHHNVTFHESTLMPASCTEIGPDPSAMVPPLPPTGIAGPWSGTCTFASVGTYTFHCTIHLGMKGTVIVANQLPTPTTTTGGGGGTMTTEPPEQIPPAASTLKLKSHQKGKSVKGSILIDRASSKLDVRALVTRKTLGLSGSGHKRVGRFLRKSIGGKKVSFKISLSHKAKTSLKNKGKLKIRIEITVTPDVGETFTKTKTVTLKP